MLLLNKEAAAQMRIQIFQRQYIGMSSKRHAQLCAQLERMGAGAGGTAPLNTRTLKDVKSCTGNQFCFFNLTETLKLFWKNNCEVHKTKKNA